MTTFTVISNANSGAGTLRSDLGIAKDGDIINFAPNVQLITVATPLEIKTGVTIEGAQPNATGTAGVIVTGNSATSEFTIDSGVSAKIDGLELSYGYSKATTGANPLNPFAQGTIAAGAVYDKGTLTLSNSIVDHNSGHGYHGYNSNINAFGGGAGGTGVGGIFVASGATLNLVGSTNAFAENTGVGGTGGNGAYGTDSSGEHMYSGGYGGSGASAQSGMAKTAAQSGTAGDGKGGGAGGAPYQAGHVGTGSGSSGGGGGGNAFADYGGPGTVNTIPVCFASGTRIHTPRGDIAVEALHAGDVVVTASGDLRPVRWLGHRTISCRNHPRPHEVLPVRIAAHAFGEARPVRDLFVSPGHAICVDVSGEVMIPAIALVNGSTIRQIDVDKVIYWHVELDSHDVILAENLPAESYLDMGNRSFFNEADIVALDASPDARVPTHADFCRPYHDHGPLVEAARAATGRRATPEWVGAAARKA